MFMQLTVMQNPAVVAAISIALAGNQAGPFKVDKLARALIALEGLAVTRDKLNLSVAFGTS